MRKSEEGPPSELASGAEWGGESIAAGQQTKIPACMQPGLRRAGIHPSRSGLRLPDQAAFPEGAKIQCSGAIWRSKMAAEFSITVMSTGTKVSQS